MTAGRIMVLTSKKKCMDTVTGFATATFSRFLQPEFHGKRLGSTSNRPQGREHPLHSGPIRAYGAL